MAAKTPATRDAARGARKKRQDLSAGQLKERGLKVEHEEIFFVETDRTTLGELGISKLSFLLYLAIWFFLIVATGVVGAVLPLVVGH